MVHFRRICCMQKERGFKDSPDLLIQSMAHVFLRPSWDHINIFGEHTENHLKIFQLLFFHGDWTDSIPLVFPSEFDLFSKKLNNQKCDLLEDADWYWGSVTRDEVKEYLKETPDGTFLVRNSIKNSGEYTLTIKKDGSDKLIKIFEKFGKFGFSQPFQFNNVVDLVNYYRKESLKKYNNALDITLLYPLSKFTKENYEISELTEIDELVKIFVNTYEDRLMKQKQLDVLRRALENVEIELQLKTRADTAFDEGINCFKDQLELHQEIRASDVQTNEQQTFDENFDDLMKSLENLTTKKAQLKNDYEIKNISYKKLERQIFLIKPLINRLGKLEERCKV